MKQLNNVIMSIYKVGGRGMWQIKGKPLNLYKFKEASQNSVQLLQTSPWFQGLHSNPTQLSKTILKLLDCQTIRASDDGNLDGAKQN